MSDRIKRRSGGLLDSDVEQFQQILGLNNLLAWYDYPISTGSLEAVNNKIQLLQSQAFGYRDSEVFQLKLYALHQASVGGGLKVQRLAGGMAGRNCSAQMITCDGNDRLSGGSRTVCRTDCGGRGCFATWTSGLRFVAGC